MNSYSSTEQNNIPICSITREVIVDPVTTPCGHTFEKKAINQWLSTKNTCPDCKSQVHGSPLRTNIEMRELFANVKLMQEQRVVMQDKIHRLEAQVKAQQAVCQQLAALNIKNGLQLSVGFPELRYSLAASASVTEQIANTEHKQKITLLEKVLLGKVIQRRAQDLERAYRAIKQEKKALLDKHEQQQNTYKALLVKRTQQLDSSNMLDVKHDVIDLCQHMEILAQDIADDVKTARYETEKLRAYYQQQVDMPKDIFFKRLEKWFHLDTLNRKLALELQNLHAAQNSMLNDALNMSLDSTINQFALFGGHKEKKPLGSIKENVELLAAVVNLDYVAAKRLLNTYQLDVNMRNGERLSLLMIAINNIDYRMINLLITHHVNINDTYKTPLSKPILSKLISLEPNKMPVQDKIKIITMLLKANVDVNARDSHKATALHWAANSFLTEVVELLLKYNADPLLRNKHNRTAYEDMLVYKECSKNKCMPIEYSRCLNVLKKAEEMSRSTPPSVVSYSMFAAGAAAAAASPYDPSAPPARAATASSSSSVFSR